MRIAITEKFVKYMFSSLLDSLSGWRTTGSWDMAHAGVRLSRSIQAREE